MSKGSSVCAKLVAFCLLPTSEKPRAELALLGAVIPWLHRRERAWSLSPCPKSEPELQLLSQSRAQSLSSLLQSQGSPSRSGPPRWQAAEAPGSSLCHTEALERAASSCCHCCRRSCGKQHRRSDVKIHGKWEWCFERACAGPQCCVLNFHI